MAGNYRGTRKVLESNPFLEAFGNSRTLRNDNSSRFGKFIEIQFTPNSNAAKASPDPRWKLIYRKMNLSSESLVLGNGKEGIAQAPARLCGARIQTYLLEKVRVTDQQEGERNFHIFYQCCAAFRHAEDGVYKYPRFITREGSEAKYQRAVAWDIDLSAFRDCAEFFYLTRSTTTELDGVDDAREFEQTVFAMQTMGMGLEDVNAIIRTIAAVLHLGNTTFTAPQGNSEGSMVQDDGTSGTSFKLAAELLGVEPQQLQQALCSKLIKSVGESVRKSNNMSEALTTRDSLARKLYDLTFDHIVGNTNRAIGYRSDVDLFCGVLDIFGFESFKVNSFEQLCINFTNECLQQFFNKYVFKLEEKLYKSEQIPWDPLDFPDNQDAVDLIQEKPHG